MPAPIVAAGAAAARAGARIGARIGGQLVKRTGRAAKKVSGKAKKGIKKKYKRKFESQQGEQEEQEEKISKLDSLLTPEAIMMLSIAVGIDLAGIVLLIFGLDDYFITDIIGFAFIGTWLLVRDGFALNFSEAAKGAATSPMAMFSANPAMSMAKKAKRAKLLKYITFIIEPIFYLGGILPLWTVTTYIHLTD